VEQRPLAQATGRNKVINIYPDRLEIRDGWQNQNVLSLRIKEVANVSISGLINCALTIEVNDGRYLTVDSMALPDARQVKNAIESQKSKASVYE
jgi:hypothetical protein